MASLTFDKGLIKEIQEWVYVYFVKLVRGRPIFVSKKNQEVKAMSVQSLIKEQFLIFAVSGNLETQGEADYWCVENIKESCVQTYLRSAEHCCVYAGYDYLTKEKIQGDGIVTILPNETEKYEWLKKYAIKSLQKKYPDIENFNPENAEFYLRPQGRTYKEMQTYIKI